jgi:hypothetical protein
MPMARLWRVFLAATVVVAMQSSLLHPFEHFHRAQAGYSGGSTAVQAAGDRSPLQSLESKLCEVCVAGAALGAAASARSATAPISFSGSSAASREESPFLAAFTPLFRSQAPPALL